MPAAPPVPGYDTPAPGATAGANIPAPQATGSPQAANGTVTVGSYTLGLNSGVNPTDVVRTAGTHNIGTGGRMLGEGAEVTRAQPSQQESNSDTVAHLLQSFNGWTTTQYEQFRQQAYQMGLTTSRTAGKAEVLVAWQTVVEEAAKDNLSTQDVIKSASVAGWNSINPAIAPGDNGLGGTGNVNNSPEPSNSTTQTTYTSYLDPATVQGALADAWQRLLGMNPSSSDYQAFLNQVYQYEDQENTGKFEDKTTDKTNAGNGAGASSNVNENVISQRQIGTRGLEFLAGQSAMANPQEGAYQAATTYFNAFAKALSAPAAGMQASGPTAMAP